MDRGSITLWIDPKSISSWQGTPTGKQGARPVYSDTAIRALSVLRFKFRLTLRSTEGFARSLLDIIGLEIGVPDYSTICRRFKNLSLSHKRTATQRGNLHIVIDSRGLKVFGEGEWKVRQHGYSKRRTWKKPHLAIDESNSRIEAVVLTPHHCKDREVFEELVEAIEIDGNIDQISGDGAYDTKGCYRKSQDAGIVLVVPPRKNAVILSSPHCVGPPRRREEHT